MSNFEFLREDFSELYEYCLEAEENCYKKPRTSAFYSRIALETCVALIYKFERLAFSLETFIISCDISIL